MQKQKFCVRVVFLLVLTFLFVTHLWANEPVVMINAKPIENQSTNYEIIITVYHDSKGRSHYIDRVVLLLNEEPVKVWQFSQKDSPKDFPFTLKESIKISAHGPSIVAVKANCRSHGESARVSLQIIPGKSY